MGTAIVWFRRDLRVADHHALSAALRHHEQVLPLYIHAPQEEGAWSPGAASRWWQHHALAALDESLRRAGGSLYLRTGSSLDVLEAVVRQAGARSVYWNRLYEPHALRRDAACRKALEAMGVEVHTYDGALWRGPSQVWTAENKPYRVFTPFWRNLRAQLGDAPELPLAAPSRVPGPAIDGGERLDSLGLLAQGSWVAGLAGNWTPGEAGARAALDLFAGHALTGYDVQRDLPDRTGTSRLSPHLHFGEITPRQIRHALARAAAGSAGQNKALEGFLRELGWREFAHHVLFHFPHTADRNLDARFDRHPWREDPAALQRWQQGRTGIPLVDAGMRELWATGWMHNRVRMITASWLTKNMGQHWLHGARWFWDTLVDADLANNSLGWQWVAGCGVDAAPYFRIFNPVIQGKRYDPDGAYIRRWIPALREAPAHLVHEPWVQPGFAASCAYPQPMLDPKASRQRALDAYANSRKQTR